MSTQFLTAYLTRHELSPRTVLLKALYLSFLIIVTAATSRLGAATQFFAGDGSALSASKWGTSAAGPFTSAFSSGNVIDFGVVNGTGTGGSITIGGIIATENFTLTAASGTIANTGNGVVSIDVSSGKTVDFSTQAFTTSATAGYTKNGTGVLALAGGTYGGGFTLNAGTVILRGVNAMGSGGTLTINGGTIAASATRDLTGKYSSIVVGGDFTLGDTTGLALSTANLTFSNNVNLGSTTRTITLGGTGTYTMSGTVSGSAGLTVAATAAGTLVLATNNSYTGKTTLSGGTVSTSGESAFGANPGAFVADQITFNGGNIKSSGAITFSSNRGITLGANGGTFDTTGGTITLTNVVTGSGALTKTAAGTLSLNAAHTYTGGTNINGGTLAISNANALGSSGTISFGGGTLQYSGITTDLSSRFSAAASQQYNVDTNSQNVTWGTTLSSSGGTLVKSGSGILTLATGNSYSGKSTINAGFVAGSDQSMLGANPGSFVADQITLNGGGIQASGGNIDFNSNRGITLGLSGGTFDTNGNTITLTAAVAGSLGGALTKTGTGTLIAAGAHTYDGVTNIQQGTLQLTTGTNRLPTGTTVNLGQTSSANLGTLDLNAFSQQIAGLNSVSGTNSGASKNTVTSATAATLTLGGSGTYSYGAGTSANSGLLSGAITLTKSGSGTQTLGDANTYTGGTNINGGTLAIANSAALGSSGTISFGGGTLQYSGITTDLSSRFSSGASQQYRVDTNGQNVTWGTALTSSGGSLTKVGSGTLTLTAASTYSGGTNIQSGTAQIGITNALPSGTTLTVGNTGTTATLDLSSSGASSFNLQVAGLNTQGTAASQTITNNSTGTGTATLTVNNDTATSNADFTFGGIIKDGTTAKVALTKSGSKTLTLSGANTYTGATIVSAGTLKVGNATALGGNASAVSVTSGAVLDVNGTTMTGTNALTLNGTGISSGGALTNSSATAATYAGLVTLGSASSIVANSGNIILSNTGTITGSGLGLTLGGTATGSSLASIISTGTGTVTKQGAGTWTLSGANTYTGGTNVSAGTLRISTSTSTFSSGAVTSGPLGAGAVTLADGISLGVGGNLIIGSTGFVLNGNINIGVSGSANRLTLNGPFNLNGTAASDGSSGTIRSLTLYNPVALASFTSGTSGANQLAIEAQTGGPANTIANGTLRLAAGASVTSGNFAVAQIGAMSFTGATGLTIADKVVTVISAGTPFTAGGSVDPRLTIESGGYFSSSTTTNARPISVYSLSGAGVFTNLSNAASPANTLLTIDGADKLANFSGVIANGASYAGTFSGISGINGTISLTMSGTGTQILSGANTYTGATTVGSGTLQIGNGDISGSLSTSSAITNNATLAFNRSNTITQGTHFNSVISGSGVVRQIGSGTLELNGSNSYAGKTIVETGTLSFTNGNISATVNQPLGTNTAVDLGAASASSGKLQYTGTGAATLAKNINALGNGSDTVQNSGTGLLTLSGSLVKTGTVLTLKGGSQGINVTGVISGDTGTANSDLFIDGGTVTLSNANTYNGPTYIRNSGTLNANAAGALPTTNRSAITFDGTGTSVLTLGAAQSVASLTSAGAATVTLNANSLTVGAASGSTTYAGAIGGTGSLTKDGASTQTLSGTNTYSGGTTLSAGRLNINNASAIGTGAFTITGGSIDATVPGIVLSTNNVLNLNGDFSFAGSNDLNLGTGNINLNANRIITVDAGTLTIGGNITSATYTISKQGNGILKLTGSNSYSGVTTISTGVLSVSSVASLGTGTAEVSIAGGSSLEYTGASGTLSKPVTVTSGTGTISNTGSGLLTLSGTLTKTGTVLNLKGGSQGINVTGVISGNTGTANSDLFIDGGTVTLSNANTYNGPTYIRNSGTLNANAAGALPTTNRSAITFDGTGTSVLTLGAAQSVASLSSAGAATVTLNANTLTVGAASGSTTFAGAIGGTGGLTKDNSSTQVLTGTNTYSGTTTVSGGTLDLSTSGSISNTTNVTVNSGGTLLLSGTNNDKINNSATVTLSGGKILLGGSESLSETVGALTLSSSSIIDFGTFAGGNTLIFGDSHGSSWTGVGLSIWNWTAGLDHLYFGNSSSGLTSVQTGLIHLFSDGGSTSLGSASLGSSGEISAVPEPSSVFVVMGLLSLAGWRERRWFLRCRKA